MFLVQGIPEEELLRQQQELFAQARAQQLQVDIDTTTRKQKLNCFAIE